MSEWWSVLPVACLALGFAAGWLLRGRQWVPPFRVPPVEEDPDDKKKPADIVGRGFFT